MKNLLWLMRKTFLNTFRNKRNWITFFVLPLAGVLFTFMVYGSSTGGTVNVGIVNEDGKETITSDTISFVTGLNHVQVTLTDEADLREGIVSGRLDCGIIFTQGFGKRVAEGTSGDLQIISVKGAQVTAYIKGLLQNYLGNLTAIGQVVQGDSQKFNQIYRAYQEQTFHVSTEKVETSRMKDMTTQSIGFLILFMMFSATNLSELILQEKENRTFLRLIASPLSSWSYVLSNVLVSMVVLFLQIIFTLTVMEKVFKITSGVPFGEMTAILLLFALTAVSLALLIVSFSKNSNMAGALQNLIVTPSCLLAGCFFPIEAMPESVRKIANFMPQRWLIDGVEKLQTGQSLGNMPLDILILIGFSGAFALIAVYKFSRNNETRMFV